MTRDWEPLYRQYRGRWVALMDDHVTPIASGKTRQEAREAAIALGYPQPFVIKMPSDVTAFA